MLYKIFNALFGWDYIISQAIFSNSSEVCRVLKLPDGTVGYWTLGRFKTIVDPTEVYWVTCGPEKYLPKSE